ncbi:outer membrane beta-barrel protein [Sphingobacterium sp. T2]|uniref:outer membrane beta-barrel protein n=1 Tax=Sphingobacterium sp. T2 TaxID=1590596 RepID=UPI00057B84B0|nr:outer membrane beta-barrel protein [Sphingobacterium sp. T2]
MLDKKFENEDLLKIEGNFTLHNKSYMNERKTELSNSFLQNKGNNTDSTKQVLPMGNVEMTFVKNFENKNRKFVGKMGLRAYKLTDREYVNEEYTVAYQMSLDTVMELNHQFVDMKNYNDSKNLMMSYVEPFLNNGLFEFKYEFEHNRIDASRYTYNWINNQPRGIIDSLTVDYGYQYFTNKMGITYQYNLPKKLKFNIGFAVQPIKMLGEILNDTLTYSYDNINLVPTSNLTYKISNNLDFQLSYKGKNNEPSFFQIAPVRNNTNSRNIIIGNPELKSEFTHSFLSTVRAFFPVRMQYLETSFIFNKVKDKIVNDKKPLENTTIQQTTFRNTNGYYDWKLNYIFNTPLGGDSWQLNLDGSVNYFNNLSFIEDRKRTTKQFLFQQALKLKYSLDEYVESSLNAVYSQNYARYDIPFRTRINVQSLFLGLGIKGYVKDNFSMGVEMSQRNNDGYFNNFMNVNQTLMNAFIEYSFLQNRTAMLRIHAYDLFDQNTNMGIYSEYIGNDLYEERKSRLGRYIMLALNIRLQK